MSNLTEIQQLYVSPCASKDIQNAFISNWMAINHSFLFTVITISFFLSGMAAKKLKFQNVFPTCTRILLFAAMFNGVVHQSTLAVIRIKAVTHAIQYKNEPCSLQFQSSDCYYDIWFYYHTNLFSSVCCFTLFLDRLLSGYPKSMYNYYQKIAAFIYILFQFIVAYVLLIWIFGNSDYSGYVPMCNYPPANASDRFFTVSIIRLVFLCFVSVASLYLYRESKNKEKKTMNKEYKMTSRYQNFENCLATKAIFIIIISQIICLVFTSAIPYILKMNRETFPGVWYHWIIAYMTGLTYSNFLVPIIIWYQTNQITSRRRCKIAQLTRQKETSAEHFIALQASWK